MIAVTGGQIGENSESRHRGYDELCVDEKEKRTYRDLKVGSRRANSTSKVVHGYSTVFTLYHCFV